MTMNQRVADFCQRYFTDRRGSNCKKWDLSQELFGAPDLLGMWIADMEFKVPEAVQKVLHERVDHGVFGYSYPCPEEHALRLSLTGYVFHPELSAAFIG